MLLSLHIQNIALMEEMQVEFHAGLHVLTGETGAGKSIIIDSISLLLGGRAQKELIRTGCQKARVEGVFSLSDCPGAHAFLQEQELEESDELVLAREITSAGRSTCRVNGTLLNLSTYQKLTGQLMDIHGQHEHQYLMDEKRHLSFLDAYGGEENARLLCDVQAKFAVWQDCRKAYEQFKKQSTEADERMELLRIRQKELKKAHLTPGEEEELTRERDRFRHAEKISDGLETAFSLVYDGSSPAADNLRRAAAALTPIESLDESFAALLERLNNLYYEAEDIGLTLRELLNNLDSDPARMEEVQSRLDLIRRLSRKYGGATVEEMILKQQEIENELAGFSNLDERLEELAQQEKNAAVQYQAAAEKLSANRQALAKKFESEMEIQLADLNMGGTRFGVQFQPCSPSASGNESAVFLLAPNRGEALQSLSKIASGGELSRLMLAIKSVAARQGGVPAMIFDEIDTGISGRAAQVVGEKMAAIAQDRQVLCVTHLQQIAALADHHYLVEKYYDGERTKTRLTILEGETRVSEIARMLGGSEESARIHAREMIKK